MTLAMVLAYGIPFDLQAVGTATILAGAVSAVLGFALPTYVRTVGAAAVLALLWFALMSLLDVPVAAALDWFGLSLRFIVGFLLIALVAHSLRRFAVVGWRRLQKQSANQ